MKVAVVGHVEWVEFVRVRKVPVPGEIVHAESWWEEPGGGGAGAAVQLGKLAGRASFFTALGDDELGERVRHDLSRLGLDVHAVARPEPTRRALTHVDATGERTITVLGERLAPFGADPLPWDKLAGFDAVYFTAGDRHALGHARQARVLVATSRVLPVLKGSGVRLDALVGSAGDQSEQFLPSDLDPPPAVSVWTNGDDGGTYTTDHGNGRYAAAPAGPIADRYGAGDSFAGGLTYGLGRGLSTQAAIELAAKCGAAVVQGSGPYAAQLQGDDA